MPIPGITTATHGLRRPEALMAFASVLVWSVSLGLPAVDIGPATAYGWQFLLHGWRGVVALNIGGLSWLANPLLAGAWLSFFVFGARSWTTLLSAGALLAASTSFLFNTLNGEQGGLAIQDFASGFHLWLASTALQTAAAVLQYRSRRELDRPEAA